MDKYEKVTRTLDIHKTPMTNGCPKDCPYYSTDFCMETMFSDALEIITEQHEKLAKYEKDGEA